MARIRDLIIVVGIYLYFTAWIYVHFYYDQFGLSTETIKIDYSSYLVYSWDVLASGHFLLITGIILGAAFLVRLIIFRLCPEIRSWFTSRQFGLSICLMILAFPYFFYHARYAAIKNYRHDRMDTRNLRTIQFIFRKQADLLSPAYS